MSNPVIEINDLRVAYPGPAAPALKGLSLQVRAGEVFGFLGPNGAGKTTTMKVLLGFVSPTSGRASIFGVDV
jgi:ABC-type multidrug transport system ATPase subunit